MLQNPQKLFYLQNKKIIFTIVGILSLQLLILISIYGDNWSIEVGSPNGGAGLPIMYSFFTEEEYSYEVLLREQDSHIHISSRIPLLFSLFFNDFDTKNLMYLGWGMLTASIFFLYQILKRQDERLIWLLIPISVFVFNPIQYFTVLWSFAFFCYGIPFGATIMITYFLNKKNVKNQAYLFSLFIGIVASFSIVGGPLALVSGIIPLAFKKDFKKLAGWIITISLVGGAYLFAWSGKVGERILLNPETQIINFLKVIALPFTVKFDVLYALVGVIIIGVFILSILYLKKSGKIEFGIPWIQISSVGILISIMVSLGKGNVSYYYSTMSDLFTIGLVGLLGIMMTLFVIDSKKKNTRILLALILIGMLVLVIPSYVMGWKLANDFNIYESKRNSCYSLNPDEVECEFNYGILTQSGVRERLQVMNKMLETDMGIFSNKQLNLMAEKDQSWYNDNFKEIVETNQGFGNILKINGESSDKVEISDDPIITIYGWIEDDNFQTVDYLYIISNNEPLLKISNFGKGTNDIETDEKNNDSFWEITFLSGYLKNDCSNLTMVGFKDYEKIIVSDEILVCKT